MKPHVVLDTNVLISGTFWTGASFEILRLVQDETFTLIVSAALIDEYEEVIQRDELLRKPAYSAERVRMVKTLLRLGLFVEPTEQVHAVKADPDDDRFLEAAVAGNAAFVISQDRDLLALQRFRGIRILTPDAFLLLVRA